jgi:molybdopterin-containing oxidoreductase family iron-sulfur binding subunit
MSEREETDDGLVPVTRRELLAMIGAGSAIATVPACTRQPTEKIVPYVRAPEEIVPGKPLYYASTLVREGYAEGVLVESHMGRPTKIEGNRGHPASVGGTSIFAQAATRTLYDPDRSQTVMSGGRISTFEAMLEELIPLLSAQAAQKGAGIRIVSGLFTSPSLLGLRDQLAKSNLSAAEWFIHEPCGKDNARVGALHAFQTDVRSTYLFDRADVVLSLGSDFLVWGEAAVRYARDFAQRRRIREHDLAGSRTMNRLYTVEATPTLTGAKADHRLTLAPREIARFARRLAGKLGIAGGSDRPLSTEQEKWLEAVAADLDQSRGKSVVVAGDYEPPMVHAIAQAINFALGNMGKTVMSSVPPYEPLDASPRRFSLGDLVRDMRDGKVELCIFLEGSNPAYTAPADLDFAEALSHVRMRVHHGLYEDETSAHCHWHVPASHELESWSDARAFDGTLSIVQPLIAPLYASKTATELVSALLGKPRVTSYEIVRETFRALGGHDEHDWQHALHDGVVAATTFPRLEIKEAPPASVFDETPTSRPRSRSRAAKPTARRSRSSSGPILTSATVAGRTTPGSRSSPSRSPSSPGRMPSGSLRRPRRSSCSRTATRSSSRTRIARSRPRS